MVEIGPEIVAATAATLELMADDEVNKPKLMSYLRGPGPHCELRTVLRALARRMQPRRYLEIGVRRGWSLAQVMAEAPDCDCTACDVWIRGYGGVRNPGAAWVRDEVARVAPGWRGRLEFTDRPSQEWLPTLAQGTQFDLITVDGDHTGLGAWQDLVLCLPMVAPGGALVFDDLVDRADAPGMTLLQAWRRAEQEFPGFIWHELAGLVPVGVAIRGDAAGE